MAQRRELADVETGGGQPPTPNGLPLPPPHQQPPTPNDLPLPPPHQQPPTPNGPPPPQPHQPPPPAQQPRFLGWEANEKDTLLVVATLITTLSYQIGANPPGGFWQDDSNGHEAGAPIMRDKHHKRYWLFMTGAWMGFGTSMLLTLLLLSGVEIKSRWVRWSFVAAYSSLLLTYITSIYETSLAMDIAVWIGVMLFVYVATRIKRRRQQQQQQEEEESRVCTLGS